MAMADSAPASAIRAVEAEEVELVIEDDGEEEEEEEEGEGEGEGDEEVEEASSMSRKEENEKEREREKAVYVGSGRGVKRPRGCTAKERISKMAPCAGKRSSIYRGVTRHRWTGRYEAHLWDKSTWNENQNKKGKQVYLGAYDEEEAAARAYDLAALKYWGPSGTQINFPVSDYSRDIEEMQNVSREEYLASLRRKSSGFSRGTSKFRCASRHYQPARWDAQMGRIWTGSSPQINNHGNLDEGGATPSLELSNRLRGGSCHTPINIACFLSWLQPGTSSSYSKTMDTITSTTGETSMHRHNRKRWSGVTEEVQSPAIATEAEEEEQRRRQETSNHQAQSSLLSSSPSSWQECCQPYRLPSLGLPTPKKLSSSSSSSSPSAYSLLFQSQMFKELLERVSSTPSPPYPHHAQGQFNNAKTQNLTELHTSSSTTTTTSPLQHQHQHPHPHPHPQLKLDPCYFKSETQYAQPSAPPPPPPRPPLLPLQRLPARNTLTPQQQQQQQQHQQQQPPQQQQVLPWNDDNAFRPPLMSWMYATTKP